MKVLILGPVPSALGKILSRFGCAYIEHADPIDLTLLKSLNVDFAVSYRYRHIVRKPILDYLQGRIINLHISLLPWNRGADPNLWSFLENTPKGVTIHYMDDGIDTGDIIVQKEVVFRLAGETLAKTYDKLNRTLLDLFLEYWPAIMKGEAPRMKQLCGGSVHRLRDKKRFLHLLSEKGWDTPVEELIAKALE